MGLKKKRGDEYFNKHMLLKNTTKKTTKARDEER